jgi:hypothetical protein
MESEAQVLILGRNRWSLAPTNPVLRALGFGFALGVFVMTLVTLFSD